MRYPERHEILNKPHLHKPEVIKTTKNWKRTTWKEARHEGDGAKLNAIIELLTQLAMLYEKPVRVHMGEEDRYSNGVIYLTRPSIITGLHELAHHLFGESETKACRWSVWLFKKTFPKAFNQLVWHGHMLVKPNVCSGTE